MIPVQTQLQHFFLSVRQRTVDLCNPLTTEDYVPQPVVYISPPKWHLGHTTWFFEEMVLVPNMDGYKRYDADFAFLFNSYYNNLGDRVMRADRGNMTRPLVEEVYAYRAHVDRHMEALLQDNRLPKAVEDLVILGLNHEQQHQELLITDLKYVLGHQPLFPVYQEGHDFRRKNQGETGWLSVEEGIYEIGFTGDGFHFDNELGRHKVYLAAFDLSRHLVTQGEYLEFMEDRGYQNFNLWLDEGWSWIQSHGITQPMYWHQIDGQWHHYTLGGLKKLEPDHILTHISYYEAAAFAEWKGMRLPTEFEWEVASAHLAWGTHWEYTQSAYLPYPGFSKAPGAVGEYNGKFMVNQMVLRGASVATSPGHSRHTYRNFFHPQYQWQFSGVRLAKHQRFSI